MTDGGDDCPALVSAAQAGNRDAFGELYRQFARTVHGVLAARLPRGDADDLVQDVFLHAMTRIRDLRDPSAFPGWICTIARRRAADHYRRAAAYDELTNDEVATGPLPDVSAEASAALDALRTLPAAYRETLALRLLEGLSGPEIAAATGLTPDSVRVNLHRGFRLLRERLGGKR